MSRAGDCVWRTLQATKPWEHVPEVHRLGADGAVPELCEARLLRRGGSLVAPAQQRLAEHGPEGVEDAGARAERHGGCIRLGVARARQGAGELGGVEERGRRE